MPSYVARRPGAGLKSLVILVATFLCGTITIAAPQSINRLRGVKATGGVGSGKDRSSEAGAVGKSPMAPMTGADILRLLDLGVPAPIIAERIRANQTHFTKLDELFAAIRRYSTSVGTGSSMLPLVAEISAAQFREGLPCSASGATCPETVETTQSTAPVTPEAASAPPVLNQPPPRPPSNPDTRATPNSSPERSAVPAPPRVAPITVTAPAQQAHPVPPEIQAVSPATKVSPQQERPETSPDETPEAPPLDTPAAQSTGAAREPCNVPSPFRFTPVEAQQFRKAAVNEVNQEYKRMLEAAAAECNSNPHVVIDPIRFVFPDTEVGEQSKTSMEISNNTGDADKGPAKAFRILSIRVTRRGEEYDEFPESYSLTQPDLQCPMDLTISVHCHLSVVFHPVREKYYNAYVSIITQDPATGQTYTNLAYLNGAGYVSDVARLNGTGPLTNHPGLRSVMGFDISGASNTKTQQKVFFEFNLNAPVGFGKLAAKKVSCREYSWLPECLEKEKVHIEKSVSCRNYSMFRECSGKKTSDEVHLRGTCKNYPQLPECKVRLERRDPLSRPLWFFLNPRITSVPQSPTSLGSLNVQSISDSVTGNNNTTAIVQGLDVQGGAELFLIRPRQGLPFWSVVKNTRARAGLALVGGLGFTTPFSPPDKTTQEFTINSTILNQFPKAGNVQAGATCTPPATSCPPNIIAFVDQDRTRFFRRYYTGLRFKTYFFSDRVKGECDDPRRGESCEGLINLFPGIVDLTTGKDEAVTGGRLNNWVFRLDAVYPLPFIPSLHIFGGANVVFARNTTTPALVLEPPAKFLPFSDPNVFVQQVTPPNRDTYRIGLGVDLLEIIKSKLNKQPPAAVTHSDAGNAGTPPAANSKPNDLTTPSNPSTHD